MALFSRLLGPRRRRDLGEITARAGEVICQVIFDIGVDRFVNGTMVLDKDFRLRFFGGNPAAGSSTLATVRMHDLAEAHVFRALVGAYMHDRPTLELHAAALVQALMRELLARSPALRALPVSRIGDAHLRA